MQRHQALQIVSQMPPPFRLPASKRVVLQTMRVRQMVGATQQRAKGFAVINDTTDGNAAEANPVIAALAANQAGTRALTDGALIGQGDLQRGIDRLRPGVCEKHLVVAVDHGRQFGGEFKRQRMTQLEGRRVVQRFDLFLDSFDNAASAVARVAAPETGGCVQNLAIILGLVIHALGLNEELRVGLEMSVRRERHPIRVEIVGHLQSGRHRQSPYAERGQCKQCRPAAKAASFYRGATICASCSASI